MTFPVTPLGWRAWVLTHLRNLATRSTMEWISAYAEEFKSRRPDDSDAGGRWKKIATGEFKRFFPHSTSRFPQKKREAPRRPFALVRNQALFDGVVEA